MGADTVSRTTWCTPVLTQELPSAGSSESSSPDGAAVTAPQEALTISHARSLRGLRLELLRTAAEVGRIPVHLGADEFDALLTALRNASSAASRRLAENAKAHLARLHGRWSAGRTEHVVAALHRVMTRSRFLKGSRSCFPLRTAAAQMSPFVEACRPVTILVSGFPFKQHDNRLKAAGPWPDLAELGALLRLTELQQALAALYPPGVHIVVLNDGGYSRPRASAEMLRYRKQLVRYAELVGLGGVVSFHDQSRFVADLLGPQGWQQRERYRRSFREMITLLASTPRSLRNAERADRRLAEALPAELLAGVPSFRDILSSLVYSVPVPVPVPPRADPQRWACDVLARPDEYSDPGLPPELAWARREVLASAWGDTVNHLAASLADVAAGVARQYPPHVRLATVASRQGCCGFSYLGGSALLPWHGTGCLDGRGVLCAEFLVSLDHRGFVPVYSELIGDDQPLLMVPFARTSVSNGRRRVDQELISSARLRHR